NDVTPISRGRYVIDDPDGIAITSGGLISLALFSGGTGIAPREYDRRRTGFSSWAGASELNDYLLGLDADASVKISQSYLLDVDTENLGFAPGIGENSNVTTVTSFDEYFAYDDGSAELTIEIDPGNTILQAYETYVNDKMLGVRVAIPRGLGPLGNQDLRLVVYVGDTMPETLIYEEDFEILQPEDFFFDSLQGFTTYTFDEELIVPAGRVFVGWEQQSASRNVGIGFDRNNSPADVQWFNVGSGFQRLRGTTTGAIMLRPLMGGFEGFQTSTEEADTDVSLLDIYPNPTSGTLHLRPRQGINTPLNNLTYRLFSFSGAMLRSGLATDRLEIGDLPAGVYLLELTAGAHRERHKIVRR
ncbi:MAG: T9SS type A sorting domain-containing protein, partial [Bacteroidota bacterium]